MMLTKDAPGTTQTQTMPDNYDLNELEALAQSIVNTPDLILEQSFDDDDDESDDLITSDVIPAKIPEGDTAFEVFGSPDPTIPMSNVPCAGCGANLHCQDPAIPGYLPSQKFTSIPTKKLRTSVCQRCLLMKYHNIALNVSVHPEEYNKIISQIRNKGGLAIIVVDLLDMPNSIFKDLPELIGHDRPLYIVGNKVDLIPKDETGYLQRTKDMLRYLCKEAGLSTTNEVMHTALVSAKTGYGIEELITQLLKDWGKKGDVYLLGCTNVGKSTLFNALLSSDYCKSTARDFISRATTSPWPGTTLNLLKFPMLNPVPWKLHRRIQRLLRERSSSVEEERLRRKNLKATGRHHYATLMGHIGQTFEGIKKQTQEDQEYKGYTLASYEFDEKEASLKEGRSGVDDLTTERATLDDFDIRHYKNSYWCYDTPGVVNPEQVINLLTQTELSVVLTNKLLQPRTFMVKPGQTMFVSGLSRINYVEGDAYVYFTVFASINLPVHVVDNDEADLFYNRNIGTSEFGIPLGDDDRLKKLPPLESREFFLQGEGWQESVADILLSSIGWVAITARKSMELQVRAYTPGARGCHLRTPALLPYAVNHRGRRIRGTAAYTVKKMKRRN